MIKLYKIICKYINDKFEEAWYDEDIVPKWMRCPEGIDDY